MEVGTPEQEPEPRRGTAVSKFRKPALNQSHALVAPNPASGLWWWWCASPPFPSPQPARCQIINMASTSGPRPAPWRVAFLSREQNGSPDQIQDLAVSFAHQLILRRVTRARKLIFLNWFVKEQLRCALAACFSGRLLQSPSCELSQVMEGGGHLALPRMELGAALPGKFLTDSKQNRPSFR